MSGDLVERIGEVSAEHAAAVEHAAWLDMQRRHLIKAALRSGRSATQIAEAARITRQRVYQIRDGRR